LHPSASIPTRQRSLDWALGLGIALVTWLVFSTSGANGFVWYDDPSYLLDNPHVSAGMSWENVRWAFTEAHSANWHPLTWISHMLDCELFGLEARGHHLMGAGIHALNAWLCFAVLRMATGWRWRSVLAALFFAVHPLRVQSVVWASERKDLLAGMFFFLCLGSYIRYARRPGLWRYMLVLLSLALGLMSKPMLVSVPALLFFMDIWPLARLGECGWRKLMLEKLPFVGLVLASIWVTLLAQDAGGAFGFASSLPLAERLPHAASSLLWYVQSSCWPAGLACFYPHPALVDADWNPWSAAVVPLGLGALSLFFALHWRRCCPAFLFGLAWFVLMLAPVIGIVQVGEQAWADRYAYLPTLGLYIAIIWPLADLASIKTKLKAPLMVLGLGAVLAAGWRTRQEIPHWKDTESLAEHALAVTRDNYVAHLALGNLRLSEGALDAARAEFTAVARIRPNNTELVLALSDLYRLENDTPAAIELYQRALEMHPKWPLVRMRLGIALAQSGRANEAIEQLESALENDPTSVDVIYNLALGYLAGGRPAKALPLLDECLRRSQKFFDARIARGEAQFQLRNYAAAKKDLLRGARVAPGKAAARLALLLASAPDAGVRDGEQAFTWGKRAQAAAPNAEAYAALAAALAEQGRFQEAQTLQEQAIEASAPGQRAEATERMQLYRAGQPYRLP